MSETVTNSSGQPPLAEQSAESSQTQRAYPKIWIVILLAFVAIIFTTLWLGAYGLLNNAIWKNSFVTSHTWTIPVGVLIFSLVVGLAQKYLHAPTMIDGGAMAAMKGEALSRPITQRFRARCSRPFARCYPGPASGLKEPWLHWCRTSPPGSVRD